MDFLRELWAFLRQRKTYWLWPLLLSLLGLSALVLLAEGSALAPLIYSIF